MCYDEWVDVGLRELRQQASELVRRVEAGEVVTVTVSGRPAARLVPAARNSWRHYEDVAELFSGPADRDWEADRRLLDDAPRDPWVRR
jgi:prevent-host-death family protein